MYTFILLLNHQSLCRSMPLGSWDTAGRRLRDVPRASRSLLWTSVCDRTDPYDTVRGCECV